MYCRFGNIHCRDKILFLHADISLQVQGIHTKQMPRKIKTTDCLVLITIPVFEKLLEDVLRTTEEWLADHDSAETAAAFRKQTVPVLFGFDGYQSGIALAIQRIVIDQLGEKEFKTRFQLGTTFSTRRLYDHSKTVKQLKDPNGVHTVKMDLRYLNIYAYFIGRYSSFGEYLQQNGFSPTLVKDQFSLQQTFDLKELLKIHSTKKQVPGNRLKNRHGSQRGIPLEYWCHYINHQADSQTNGSSYNQLEKFRATFYFTDHHNIRFEVKRSSPSNSRYYGEVKLGVDERYAVITAEGELDGRKRPLSIIIPNNSNRNFRNLEICFGYFVQIDESNKFEHNLIVFEQVKHAKAPSQIDPSVLEFFLKNIHQDLRKEIFLGNITDLKIFREYFNLFFPEWQSRFEVQKRLSNTYFEAFILSKKDVERPRTIERALFHITDFNTMICRSWSPQFADVTYYGQVRYPSTNKIILSFDYLGKVNYQLLLELITDQSGNIVKMVGNYSGINQNNKIVGGRCMMYALKDEVDYERKHAAFFRNASAEIEELFIEYPELRKFFSGDSDNHLLNDNNQLFSLPSLGKYWNAFYNNREYFELDHLPGLYYYYRTSTIKGKIHAIRRYPILIKPDGDVKVKYLLQKNQVREAIGTAVNLEGRLYIDLFKKERYDGLAILYPEAWREGEKVIPGLYVSTSKNKDVMAGRMYFYKLSDKEQSFHDLQPRLIDTLEQPLTVLDQTEELIIRQLTGQLGNYLAVRHSWEHLVPRPTSGEELFAAACFYARREDKPTCFALLEKAILNGGFFDSVAFKEALTPRGALYLFKEQVKSWMFSYFNSKKGTTDENQLMSTFYQVVFA